MIVAGFVFDPYRVVPSAAGLLLLPNQADTRVLLHGSTGIQYLGNSIIPSIRAMKKDNGLLQEHGFALSHSGDMVACFKSGKGNSSSNSSSSSFTSKMDLAIYNIVWEGGKGGTPRQPQSKARKVSVDCGVMVGAMAAAAGPAPAMKATATIFTSVPAGRHCAGAGSSKIPAVRCPSCPTEVECKVPDCCNSRDTVNALAFSPDGRMLAVLLGTRSSQGGPLQSCIIEVIPGASDDPWPLLHTAGWTLESIERGREPFLHMLRGWALT